LVALSTADTNKWPKVAIETNWPPKSRALAEASPEGSSTVAGLNQRQRRLTEPETGRLAARYREGATVYELAAEFDVNRRTVAARLKRTGVGMRRSTPGEAQIAEMVRLYESGFSLAKVAEQVGVSTSTVLNYVRRNGVECRDTQGRSRSS
jgi:DNA-binding CsgD family transcriptional regulator